MISATRVRFGANWGIGGGEAVETRGGTTTIGLQCCDPVCSDEFGWSLLLLMQLPLPRAGATLAAISAVQLAARFWQVILQSLEDFRLAGVNVVCPLWCREGRGTVASLRS